MHAQTLGRGGRVVYDASTVVTPPRDFAVGASLRIGGSTANRVSVLAVIGRGYMTDA